MKSMWQSAQQQRVAIWKFRTEQLADTKSRSNQGARSQARGSGLMAEKMSNPFDIKRYQDGSWRQESSWSAYGTLAVHAKKIRMRHSFYPAEGPAGDESKKGSRTASLLLSHSQSKRGDQDPKLVGKAGKSDAPATGQPADLRIRVALTHESKKRVLSKQRPGALSKQGGTLSRELQDYLSRSDGAATQSSRSLALEDPPTALLGQASVATAQGESQATITIRQTQGAQILAERRQASRALESRYQNLVPCAAPVRIDPSSYNGEYFYHAYQPHYNHSNVEGAKTKHQGQRVERQLLYVPKQKLVNHKITDYYHENFARTKSLGSHRQRPKTQVGRRGGNGNHETTGNYYNQRLIAEYQATLVAERDQAAQARCEKNDARLRFNQTQSLRSEQETHPSVDETRTKMSYEAQSDPQNIFGTVAEYSLRDIGDSTRDFLQNQQLREFLTAELKTKETLRASPLTAPGLLLELEEASRPQAGKTIAGRESSDLTDLEGKTFELLKDSQQDLEASSVRIQMSGRSVVELGSPKVVRETALVSEIPINEVESIQPRSLDMKASEGTQVGSGPQVRSQGETGEIIEGVESLQGIEGAAKTQLTVAIPEDLALLQSEPGKDEDLSGFQDLNTTGFSNGQPGKQVLRRKGAGRPESQAVYKRKTKQNGGRDLGSTMIPARSTQQSKYDSISSHYTKTQLGSYLMKDIYIKEGQNLRGLPSHPQNLREGTPGLLPCPQERDPARVYPTVTAALDSADFSATNDFRAQTAQAREHPKLQERQRTLDQDQLTLDYKEEVSNSLIRDWTIMPDPAVMVRPNTSMKGPGATGFRKLKSSHFRSMKPGAASTAQVRSALGRCEDTQDSSANAQKRQHGAMTNMDLRSAASNNNPHSSLVLQPDDFNGSSVSGALKNPNMIFRTFGCNSNVHPQNNNKGYQQLQLTKSLIQSFVKKPIAEAKMSESLRKGQFNIQHNYRVGPETKATMVGRKNDFVCVEAAANVAGGPIYMTRDTKDGSPIAKGLAVQESQKDSLENLIFIDLDETAVANVANNAHLKQKQKRSPSQKLKVAAGPVESVDDVIGTLDVEMAAEEYTEEIRPEVHEILQADRLSNMEASDAESAAPSRTSNLADDINQRIYKIMLAMELDEVEQMDQDELNAKLFDRFTATYASISKNAKTHGYAKGPDFHCKQERLQRLTQSQWLKSRGKDPSTAKRHVILNKGIDYITVPHSHDKFGQFNKNDVKMMADPELQKTNEKISQDKVNEEILLFVGQLFNNWLEDYQVYCQQLKERNVAHHKWQMNEAVAKNLADKCLPVDYFMERMLQVGLCRSMQALKTFIGIALQFDNAGFVGQIMDQPRQSIDSDLEDELVEKREAGQPEFIPLNRCNRDSLKFIRTSLEEHLQKTDRISVNQFLSLFNVHGVDNANRLDKFMLMLRRKVGAKRDKEIQKKNQQRQTARREAKTQARPAESHQASYSQNQLTQLKGLLGGKREQGDGERHRSPMSSLAAVVRSRSGQQKSGTPKKLDGNTENPHCQDEHGQGQPPGQCAGWRGIRQRMQFCGRVVSPMTRSWDVTANSSAGRKPGSVQTWWARRLWQTLALDSPAVKQLRDKERIKQESIEADIYENEHMQAYKKLADGLDTVRKQLILGEVCKDLVKIQEILRGLKKYDSVQKTVTRDLKNPSRVARQEGIHKRQYYRKQYQEFVIKELREKYARQLGLLYAGDEAVLGRDMLNGVFVEMKRQARDYGIESRTLLVKIASLMNQYNINLTTDNYKNPCSAPKRPKDDPRGQAPGILGWLVELSQHDDISGYLNTLVNMITEQIHDREATAAYPNEDAEQLLQMGDSLWSQEIDPRCLLRVSRVELDNFFLRHGVVKNYREIDRFAAGVLSGEMVRRHDEIRRCQFMKFVVKGVLRDSVKNILCFIKLGTDNDVMNMNGEADAAKVVPLSHQVQRLQRYILYCGIKTKNSQGVAITTRQDFLDQSDSCADIVGNLQHLKHRGRFTSLDSCKLDMVEHQAWIKNHRGKLERKLNILSDLDVVAWDLPMAVEGSTSGQDDKDGGQAIQIPGTVKRNQSEASMATKTGACNLRETTRGLVCITHTQALHQLTCKHEDDKHRKGTKSSKVQSPAITGENFDIKLQRADADPLDAFRREQPQVQAVIHKNQKSQHAEVQQLIRNNRAEDKHQFKKHDMCVPESTTKSVVAMQLRQDLLEIAAHQCARDIELDPEMQRRGKTAKRNQGRLQQNAEDNSQGHAPGDAVRLALAERTSLIQRQKDLLVRHQKSSIHSIKEEPKKTHC